MRCGTCRFFVSVANDYECHRHAPVMPADRAMDGCFPVTQENGWCGEYEPESPPKDDLARYYHDTWSAWMLNMIHQAVDKYEDDDLIHIKWPTEVVERWTRRMHIPYDELPDSDREAAKAEARKILNIIRRGG